MKFDSSTRRVVDAGGNFAHGTLPDNIRLAELKDQESAIYDRIMAMAPESRNDQNVGFQALLNKLIELQAMQVAGCT